MAEGGDVRGIEGRHVVVTGAASGIGRACVERLVAEGALVTALDVADDDADTDTVRHRRVDVRDPDALAEAVAEAAGWTGRIDGLVTAAGVASGGAVHQLPPDEWARVLAVNLTGTFLACRLVLGVMVAQAPVDGGRGSVVTVASVEGLEGTAGGSAYSASKGGVVLLTKTMAIDYGPVGIRVNSLCPGFIETPLTEAVFGDPVMAGPRDDCRREHALRRFGRAGEVAAAACFLLSADASFVTGHSLVVDGGYTAGRDHGITGLLGLDR